MKTSIAYGTTQVGTGELIWRQLSHFAAEIRRARTRRRAYNALFALDDRTLRDIGVDRDQIWDAVDKALGTEAPVGRDGRKSIAA